MDSPWIRRLAHLDLGDDLRDRLLRRRPLPIQPLITELRPTEAIRGDLVKALGVHLSTGTIRVGGRPATVVERTSTSVVFEVPIVAFGPQPVSITLGLYSATAPDPLDVIGATDAFRFRGDRITGGARVL